MRYHTGAYKRKTTLSDWPFLLATFLVCLLCWSAGYYSSIGFPLTENDAIVPLWGKLIKLLSNRFFVYFVGFLLVILIAFVLNRINDIEMLIPERTLLIGMFLVLFLSTNVGFLPFSEKTVVLLCFVFLIHELFNAYQSPESTGKFFNIGVLIGFSGLFMPQVLWLIPFIWIGMYQFYSLSFRSFFAYLIGVLIIYWLVLGWCVWVNDFSMFVSLFNSLMDFELFSVFLSFQYYHFSFVLIIILLIASFFIIKIDTVNNRVRVRQMLSFLLYLSMGLVALILLYGNEIDSFLTILYLPFSVVLAYFFENLGRRFKFSLYFAVLILFAFFFTLRIWNY